MYSLDDSSLNFCHTMPIAFNSCLVQWYSNLFRVRQFPFVIVCKLDNDSGSEWLWGARTFLSLSLNWKKLHKPIGLMTPQLETYSEAHCCYWTRKAVATDVWKRKANVFPRPSLLTRSQTCSHRERLCCSHVFSRLLTYSCRERLCFAPQGLQTEFARIYSFFASNIAITDFPNVKVAMIRIRAVVTTDCLSGKDSYIRRVCPYQSTVWVYRLLRF